MEPSKINTVKVQYFYCNNMIGFNQKTWLADNFTKYNTKQILKCKVIVETQHLSYKLSDGTFNSWNKLTTSTERVLMVQEKTLYVHIVYSYCRLLSEDLFDKLYWVLYVPVFFKTTRIKCSIHNSYLQFN